MSSKRIMIVDDEDGMCKLLASILSAEGYETAVFLSAEDALASLKAGDYSVALVDIKMPGMDGLDFIVKAREIDPSMQFIMMTAYGSIESAVEAIKIGAFDYITKPFKGDEILLSVIKALEHIEIVAENKKLRTEINILNIKKSLNVASPRMLEVVSMAEKIAPSNLTVLITGESGTGKEVIARYIHSMSGRSDMPFVPVQCSLLPVNLLESELFGFKKGAFTGATENRMGLFEQANNGTIFLDEIGDISLDIQGKLLRFLQDREIRRIGDNKSITLDVRLIAATNKDLEMLIKEKLFREDLFFRLKVLSIYIPPLRERIEDIPLLVGAFIEQLNQQRKFPIVLDSECMNVLMNYNWPGNVRELKNCIESASALCDGNVIRKKDILPLINFSNHERRISDSSSSDCGDVFFDKSNLLELTYGEAKSFIIEEFEKKYIAFKLKKNNGNISAASREAKIDRKNFWQLLKKYDINPDSFK
ncbi:MAG TPA: sigma-54 dependent transcriptional regulator [Spirochaetota bacterium]|nr:sigma-54 dependent transcriptional regulator [Spirochaetota bacterium]HOK91370.1 sigma-54 dependent transcriptional regulator [Spirochaetota bacterium]HPP93955.1 sigma-54 dependent transcriptional regulator [Spirochaetota bacterium]